MLDLSEQEIQLRMSRIWAMPNPFTFHIKPVREFILAYVEGVGNNLNDWFDPFAGTNPFKLKYSNDLNPEMPTTFHMDAVDFLLDLKKLLAPPVPGAEGDMQFSGAFFDPPYTLHQTNQVYKGFGVRKPISLTKDLIAPLIKMNGIVLTFGHNSGGMGLKRGFKLLEVLLVPHGGSHDDTICTAEKKVTRWKTGPSVVHY